MFGEGPVHMVGIGGSGMASLAELLMQWGVRVSGSDRVRGDSFWRLLNAGARLCVGHSARNLPPGCRLLIHSAAVPQNNPEIAAAKKRNIPILKYSQMLGLISRHFRTIAVAGSHGKTTVTAMVVRALHDAFFPCSFVVGGEAYQLRALPRPPKAPFFVTEACEFDRSFLNLRRSIAVITNIEPDHLDYYGTERNLLKAFYEFASGAEEFVVLNADDANCRRLARRLSKRVVTFGRAKDAQFRILHSDNAGNLMISHSGGTTVIHLSVIGRHNCFNAACAFALLSTLGLSSSAAAASLSTFRGVARRLQVISRSSPVVIDDYAHHPTEIEAVVPAVKDAFPPKPLFVFQPHQHSRLLALFDDFVSAFSDAEDVLLLPVYSVREGGDMRCRINHAALGAALQTQGLRVRVATSFEDGYEILRREAEAFSTVCFMGAGDIYRLARGFAATLKSKAVGRARHAG